MPKKLQQTGNAVGKYKNSNIRKSIYMYDLIIKNGTVIDGTGAPAQHSDIAILGGKITKIARNIREESKEIIDAKGLTATPGFIDSHSHADDAMLEFPDMIEKIEQGITTSIGGQCGATLAPIEKGITEAQVLIMCFLVGKL